MPERLQKILAQAGCGSRRACEDFITAGRVRVNGKIAELRQKADLAVDKITVHGKPIAAVEPERGDDRQSEFFTVIINHINNLNFQKNDDISVEEQVRAARVLEKVLKRLVKLQ